MGEDIERWLEVEQRQMRFAPPLCSDAPKTIETMYVEFDGTGVPMVPHEVAGRKGKQQDGGAKTREAKLGCVFTQTDFDEEGRPIRDPGSTSFIGAIETASNFGWHIYGEAARRGLFNAERSVCITDGAEWIKNLAQHHFPNAAHIIDIYHCREHLMKLCRLLFDGDLKRCERYKERWWDLLDQGRIEEIDASKRSLRKRAACCPGTSAHARTRVQR